MKQLLNNSAALFLLFISILQSRAYEFFGDTTLDYLKTTDSFLSLFSSKSIRTEVRNIGDINGDDIDDLMLYDISISYDSTYTRLAYIVFGSQSIPSSIDVDNLLVNGQGFAIDGNGYSSRISFVSPAGDINDDGIDDFVLAAPCFACVIFGRRDGFTDINMTNLTQTQGFQIYPEDSYRYYCGFLSVSKAGDFNNDGVDDIMIGYMTESPLNRSSAGSVYILFGHPGTFSDFNLTHFANGTQGLKIIGAHAYEVLGLTMSSIGDFNGDGIDDVAMTSLSIYYPESRNNLYVIYGHEGEFQDLDLATLTEDQGIQVTERKNNTFWNVTNGGDFDGDGLNDLVFSHNDFSGGPNVTILYVLFGAQGGYNNFDLIYLQDIEVLKIISNSANSGYKGPHQVANFVDVNGDGLSDLLFGLPEEIQVVYGRKQRVPYIHLDNLTPADGFRIKNIPFYYPIPFSMNCLDFNNDGAIDFVIGAETTSLIYGGILPKRKNVVAIVVGVVVPSVLVLVGIGIYVIRRRSLKRKADEKNKMKPIPQTPNQDSPTALSWPTSPVSNTREDALTLFKVKATGESQPVSNILNSHQKIENNRQDEEGEEQQNNPELCVSSLLEQVGKDEEAPQEKLVKPSQAIH